MGKGSPEIGAEDILLRKKLAVPDKERWVVLESSDSWAKRSI